MILNALEGKPLPIYGDGGNVRDWLYVEDHCRGVLAVLERGPAGREVQPRRRQRAHQPRDRRRASATLLERERPGGGEPGAARRAASPPTASSRRFVADRPGHDRRYAIDDAQGPRASSAGRRATTSPAGLARHRALVPRQPRLVRGGAGGQLPARAARAAASDVSGAPRIPADRAPGGHPRRARSSTATRAASSSRPTTSEKYRDGGIAERFVQDNHSRSARGTLRGLHAQLRDAAGQAGAGDRGRRSWTWRWTSAAAPPPSAAGSASSSRPRTSASSGCPPGFAHGFCVLSRRRRRSSTSARRSTTATTRSPSPGTIPEIGIAWPVERAR